ncbi:MAG: hypothetical protein ACREU9_13330 [Gammaproteobacteria bacterium]
MATSKIDIGVEIVKVSALAWFLFYAFNDASFPAAVWKPLTALLKAGVVVLAYLAGRHFATTYDEGWKNYLLVFYVVAVITIVSWAGLGTHTEDADPLFGGGETIIDFVPKPGERDDHAISIFLTLLIPAIYGMYKKRNA